MDLGVVIGIGQALGGFVQWGKWL